MNVTAADDGTAVVDAVLPAAGGQALYERLREMASGQVCRHDPRTAGQRRADALVALADGAGRLVCRCGREDCPRAITGDAVPVARKALVQVGVSAETLAGLRDNPALLAGFGAIDADLARQLARHARFDVITDDKTGTSTDDTTATSPGKKTVADTELRYRPGARVASRARALDGICRAPGCQTPAAACDLDHQDRFDHADPASGGRTTPDNLGARCRRHHRLKTYADNRLNRWQVVHHEGRRVEWRTPSGASVVTVPEGVQFLFPTVLVPPVTADGVPDAEPLGSIWEPGDAVNEMTEMLHVYTTPAQRRQHRSVRRGRHNM